MSQSPLPAIDLRISEAQANAARTLLTEAGLEAPRIERNTVNNAGRTIKKMLIKAAARALGVPPEALDADNKLNQQTRQMQKDGKTRTNFRNDYGGFRLAKARGSGSWAVIRVSGRPIPVYRFGAQPQLPPTPSGVTYRIGADAPVHLPHAFIAKMHDRTGYSVYERKGKDRFPVSMIKGPSVASALQGRPEYQRLLNIDGPMILNAELINQIDQAIERARKKAGSIGPVAARQLRREGIGARLGELAAGGDA